MLHFWGGEFCRTWRVHDDIFIFLPLMPTGSTQGETTAPNNPVMCWLMECPQGIRWCLILVWLFTLCMHIFLWRYLWRCILFLLVHDLKGLAAVLCRQRAPLMLSMQPIKNSILLYLLKAFFFFSPFLTVSRCGEQCHDTTHHVCSPCFIQQRNSPFFCFVIQFYADYKDVHLAWLSTT